MTTALDPAPILAWLAPRAIAGIEHVDASGYRRTLLTPSGVAVASAAVDAGSASGVSLDGGADAEAAMRAVFAVDLDTAEADARLVWAAERHDVPLLAASVAAAPLLRAPGCADPHEMVFRAVVGQQISVAAATGQLRLLATLGDVLPSPVDGLDRVFPTDAQVAAGAVDVLRGPVAKSEAVARVAAALDDGTVVVEQGVDLERMRAQLVALKGIGPWTAGYVSLRLGDPDVLLLGDSAVRAGARRLGIDDLPGLAADVTPWRTQLMLHCWRASA
ncbi:DNA-3-methyladenine glycosylase 2 [Agrococcus jejuensis]|uniref:3-methyladenine DNA glycosylase/8-oxoguanine DNA glycosylase n=1 Tax=Agrococcus jejuensis TaxID=399736 RepID=A0A1G8GH22_9MICO|nr:AlkA N-terminal domain-containing protein [Agrococcus jejuensis]SDH93683.1 3-methyladenine DNA glycosylase/8-oxoguanine DNA glycosylase [Agrococcus jejuensis]